jgi:hypothetical protein
LTPVQKTYAALDAWVALDVWDKLQSRKISVLPLKFAGPLDQLVSVYSRSKEVARGIIVQQPTSVELGPGSAINVTRSRALVQIDEVLSPSYSCSLHKRTLESFGPPPFQVVATLSSLRTRSSDVLPPPQLEYRQPVLVPVAATNPPAIWQSSEDMTDLDYLDNIDEISSDSGGLDGDDNLEHQPYHQPPSAVVPSRILADVWHVMDRILRTIPKSHSARRAFATAFSDTMLVPDKADKALVTLVLAAKNQTWQRAKQATPQ